jgi:hypothetical protein
MKNVLQHFHRVVWNFFSRKERKKKQNVSCNFVLGVSRIWSKNVKISGRFGGKKSQ